MSTNRLTDWLAQAKLPLPLVATANVLAAAPQLLKSDSGNKNEWEESLPACHLEDIAITRETRLPHWAPCFFEY